MLKNILLGGKRQGSSDRIYVSPKAKLIQAPSAKIINSNIRLENDARLIIGDNVLIQNYVIRVLKGECIIESETQLIGATNGTSVVYIEDGKLKIGDHCIIKSEFTIRYGGVCSIGSYTGIMDETEIRCDEAVSIGSYNMISYECMIYDTNTHCQYTPEVRREMTRKSFPSIGAEKEKPLTAPLKIGDDCWLGKRSVVLKGVTVGNNTTVAACAVLTKSCADNSIAYGNPAISKIKEV